MMSFSTAATVSLLIATIFVLIFGLITVALLGAIALGLKELNKRLDKAIDAAQPVLNKSTDVLDTVQRITMNVGEKADAILSQGETLSEKLASQAERTASVVEQAVTSPLINLASLFAGVTRGVHAFTKNTTGNKGHDNGRQ